MFLNAKVIKRIFNFLLISGLGIVCGVCTYYIIKIATFPEEISLIAGQGTSFGFNLPLNAKIENETVSVVSSKDDKVSDNISVSLNDNVTITPENDGEVDMELSLFGIPVKNVSIDVLKDIEVVPCGLTVGVKINTAGVMVLGTGEVTDPAGKRVSPSEGILKSGDTIISIDGQQIENKENLIEIIESKNDQILIKFRRNDEIIESFVMPVKSEEDKKNKIGVWVRDSTQGIGTVTYYNPDSNKFGALGHGILDVDTKRLMTVKNGEILGSDIVSVKRGKKGSPGELIGNIHDEKVLGFIKSNTEHGLYGYIKSDEKILPNEKTKIALQGRIHEGPAQIISNVQGNEAKKYDIYIETVNKYSKDDSKGMVIRITDQELLTKTNGIVQGMSGSPIIQDGLLIGAVTHVFVQNPMKGYAIFIENMIKQEKNI